MAEPLKNPVFVGQVIFSNGPTQTTVGAAGSASALPANPTGYLRILISGTEYVIPFYTVS